MAASLADGLYRGTVAGVELAHVTIDFAPGCSLVLPIGASADVTFTSEELMREVVLTTLVVGRARMPDVLRYTMRFRLLPTQEPG
ncbi:MAG: hypothetical protein EXR75_08425, partial [Myxococcales bacterium]|nr:hypothetical protein [Myxococcales bacterium]